MMDYSAQEAMAMWSANSITCFTIYLTFTFAYLTAAYFAGAKLSKYQVIIISVLYSAGSLIALLACINNLQFYSVLLSHSEELRSSITFSGEFWAYYITPFFMVGIIVSLSFMWNIRHPKTE
jgi:hypothetical protein